jgi:hypothetical protein
MSVTFYTLGKDGRESTTIRLCNQLELWIIDVRIDEKHEECDRVVLILHPTLYLFYFSHISLGK